MAGNVISRRGFLKSSVLCTGGMLMFNYCNTRSSLWNFFSMHEGLTVEAITEQIIPSDEDPGGRDAGVVYFIDKQLQGPYRRFQESYKKGLAYLDLSSLEKFRKKYIKLEFDEQTRILEWMEKDELPADNWKDMSQSQFFRLVCSHSLQGFYGDPKHGGNREFVSYKMLELPVIQF
jgi:gluconate 2-dehydrogenase gamma chain